MSVEQLKSITVDVTNGSPVVTGSGNSWGEL